MLKKSLKAGSIIVLLFSLLFFIGCSNGTTDTEPDTDTPPVGPPTPTDPVDPRVTRVTIVEKDVEVGRGESRFFTAQVEGVGDFDSTVTWQVLPAEAGEESPLNTIITSKGKLTLDGGLHIGQDVWIQASAGNIRDIARVIVAPEGPYFTWEPGRIKRDANQAIGADEVFGYLRGYSYKEKDIRLRVGRLEENVDYVIGTENGVHGVGADTSGSELILTGESTPYEGVSVLLTTGRITLDDPTKTGIIRITMLPGAFFGNDVGELNPGRTSLVIEVSDHRAIDELVNLDMAFAGTDTMPIQGKAVPRGVYIDTTNEVLDDTAHPLAGTSTEFSYAFVEWSHLSLAGNFEKQADADVVASVTLRTQADAYFLKSFETNPSAISNAGAFINGSPVVSNVTVSVDGKTLTFDLTYKVYALILKDTEANANIGVDLKTVLGSGAYGFADFDFEATPLTHKDPLPPLKWTANSYFTAQFVWDANSAGVDADAGTFAAARWPQENHALGTLTLTPRVGYTFEGTDLDDVALFNTTFTSGTTPVKTAVLGDGGSLILGFSYDIAEKEITTADIKPENFATLIARPIHGKSIGVRSTFTATEDSPYTGTVLWTGPFTNPARNGRFSTDDPAVLATVTLKAKTGYVFDNAGYTGEDTVFSAAVAVDGPTTLDGTFETTLGANIYEVTVELDYNPATVILEQITSLDGFISDLINPVAGTPIPTGANAFTPTVVTGSPFANPQTTDVVVYNGNDGTNYTLLDSVRVKYTIEPAVGSTFKADEGTYAYFAVDDLEGTPNGKTAAEKAAYIAEYFSKVYHGSIIPENSRVRVNAIDLDASDNLVLDLTYPKKPAVIDDSMFTGYLELGDWADVPVTGESIPSTFSTPGASSNYTTAIEFHVKGVSTPVTETTFEVGTTYEAWITVTPKNGYTFVGTGNDPTNLGLVEAAVENAVVYGTGTSADLELTVTVEDISVKGFIVDADETVVPAAKDKIIIVLEFDATI